MAETRHAYDGHGDPYVAATAAQADGLLDALARHGQPVPALVVTEEQWRAMLGSSEDLPGLEMELDEAYKEFADASKAAEKREAEPPVRRSRKRAYRGGRLA